MDDLAQTELILEWLFDSSDTDDSGDEDMKPEAFIMDLEDIARMRDTLITNRYLSKRVPLAKDIAHVGILFDNINPRTFQMLFRMSRDTLINYLRLYKEIQFLKPSLLDGSKSNVGLSLVSSYISVGTLDLECELQSTLVWWKAQFSSALLVLY